MHYGSTECTKKCAWRTIFCAVLGGGPQEHFDRNTPRREALPNGRTPALQGGEASYNGLDAY